MDNYTRDLSAKLSRLSTQEERVDLLERAVREDAAAADKVQLPLVLGDPRNSSIKKQYERSESVAEQINALSIRYGLHSLLVDRIASRVLDGLLPNENQWSFPVSRLPCANVKPHAIWKCPKAGVHACSGCLIVSYCSSACQKAHWGTHKRDCKHILNSKEWVPGWIREARTPTFTKPFPSNLETVITKGHHPVGLGGSLWGNVPAMNILNLERNEGALYKEDLSLAFAASGDLRNVVLTINSIPDGYTGRIFVAVNDLGPHIAARNLLLLLGLSCVRNRDLAADIVLHLWYSVFIPEEYHNRIAAFVTPALLSAANGRLDWKGDDKLRIICDITLPFSKTLGTYLRPGESLNPDAAAKEYTSVMFSPYRVDYHDRYYCGLKPAHRLATRQFRNHGLVIPFGAADPHFNTPNATLFSEGGRWLQDDSASPLDGWDLANVIAAGKTRGAREEDIFGCLYFYLHEEFVKFKSKLSNLDITFYLTSMDCRDLAAHIRASAKDSNNARAYHQYPTGLPTKFDRIDISNTVDDVYVGYSRSLADWGPLLNSRNPHSTLLTYSMNWMLRGKGKSPEDEDAYKHLREKFIKEEVGRQAASVGLNFSPVSFVRWGEALALKWDRASSVMHENSKAFGEYLGERRVRQIAADLGLQMRSIHTITPRRHGVSLDALPQAIPEFSDENDWYTQVYLSQCSFYTRFQEFCRATG